MNNNNDIKIIPSYAYASLTIAVLSTFGFAANLAFVFYLNSLFSMVSLGICGVSAVASITSYKMTSTSTNKIGKALLKALPNNNTVKETLKAPDYKASSLQNILKYYYDMTKGYDSELLEDYRNIIRKFITIVSIPEYLNLSLNTSNIIEMLIRGNNVHDSILFETGKNIISQINVNSVSEDDSENNDKSLRNTIILFNSIITAVKKELSSSNNVSLEAANYYLESKLADFSTNNNISSNKLHSIQEAENVVQTSNNNLLTENNEQDCSTIAAKLLAGHVNE